MKLLYSLVMLLVLPDGQPKESTRAVYRAFDERGGAAGFDERRAAVLTALSRASALRDLAHLPRNDLVSSPVAAELEKLGAVRADVSGAGPTVYGLFEHPADAERAATTAGTAGRTWLARPV